jgi:hypothetical protein
MKPATQQLPMTRFFCAHHVAIDHVWRKTNVLRIREHHHLRSLEVINVTHSGRIAASYAGSHVRQNGDASYASS